MGDRERSGKHPLRGAGCTSAVVHLDNMHIALMPSPWKHRSVHAVYPVSYMQCTQPCSCRSPPRKARALVRTTMPASVEPEMIAPRILVAEDM